MVLSITVRPCGVELWSQCVKTLQLWYLLNFFNMLPKLLLPHLRCFFKI